MSGLTLLPSQIRRWWWLRLEIRPTWGPARSGGLVDFKSVKKGLVRLSWCLGGRGGREDRTGQDRTDPGSCSNVQYWAGQASQSTVSDLAGCLCLVSGLRSQARPGQARRGRLIDRSGHQSSPSHYNTARPPPLPGSHIQIVIIHSLWSSDQLR